MIAGGGSWRQMTFGPSTRNPVRRRIGGGCRCAKMHWTWRKCPVTTGLRALRLDPQRTVPNIESSSDGKLCLSRLPNEAEEL